jgi:hypothetical protein
VADNQTATYAGRSIITARLKGAGAEPKFLGWGTGTVTGSANSDVNLFTPASEARVSGASPYSTYSFLADTYMVTGNITAGASKTITEAGLFDTGAASPTANLSAAIASATATAFSLNATIGPTSLNFYAQIGNEVVLVTGGQNTAVLLCARGQLGSTAAASYASGTAFPCGGDGGAYVNGRPAQKPSATPIRSLRRCCNVQELPAFKSR